MRILPAADSWDPTQLAPDVDIDAARTPNPAGELAPGRRFGQTFVCGKDGLARLEVLTATYRKAIPAGTLEVHLRAGVNQATDIACVSIPSERISDNSYVTLDFGPLSTSAGKTYYFYLEAHDVPSGYALTVWRSNSDIYSGGSFYVDGHPSPHAIAFRTYCLRR